MTLTPRGPEIAALVELLDQEWDTPEALAKAVLKRSFELVQQREKTWMAAVPNGYGQLVAYGPFATQGDAERAAAACEFEGVVVRPMYGVPELLPPADTDDGRRLCVCRHPKGTHDHVKGRGWCWAEGGSIKRSEGNKCGCKQYVEAA